MPILKNLFSGIKALFHKQRRDQELDEELRAFRDASAEEKIRRGLDPQQALRAARVEMGSIETVKEKIRSSTWESIAESIWDDIRYSFRMMTRSPGFTTVAILSLALGIGANTIIFTLAKGVLLDRLAVPRPSQLRLFAIIRDRRTSPLHSFWGDFYSTPDGRSITHSFSYPVYQLLRQQNLAKPVLEDLFAFKHLGDYNRLTASIDGHADTVTGELVSGNFYQQLGVQPVLGRAIQPSDDTAPGSGPVAVISDGLWARLFGRSPSVIGKTIQLNLIPITIIGVNPPGFTGVASVQISPDVFLPFSMQPTLVPERTGSVLQDPSQWWMSIMGRARPGVSDEAVRSAFAVWLDQDIRATVPVQKDASMPDLVIESGSKGLAAADP